MKISSEIINNIVILRIDGELDYENTEQVGNKINELLENNQNNIVLNMKNVDYINSAGLRILVQAWKKANNVSGCLKFSNLQIFVQRMFRITNLSGVFNVYIDEMDAVKSFK